MGMAPADSAAMLARVDVEPFRGDLIRSRYQHVWFSRGTDDYLLYLQAYSYLDASDCSDVTMEFTRVDGQWTLTDKWAIECID